MKNPALLSLAILAGVFPAFESSMAQDNYVAPAIVYTDDDPERLVDDEITGGQIAIGRYFTDHFALEGLLGSSALSGSDDLDILEYGINAIFTLDRERRLSPYLLLGVGAMNVDSDLFGDADEDFATYGIGVNYRVGDGPLALRLEHRSRDSSQGLRDLEDRITSLGLSYAFGKADTMPAPAVAMPDPDSDGDGVPDSRDQCPDTPAGYRVDSRGCPMDADGDGVIDELDECPGTVRGAAVDARGCEMDDDGDGVVNRLDECPDTRVGARVDVNGCEIRDVIRLPGVTFETNSDRLLPGAEDVLADAAATLRMNSDISVEVAGHTDSQGAAEYNESLSERRALTVRDYLIRAGVSASQLTARGYGESEPVADNNTAAGRAQNRRVELRIVAQ